VRGGTPARAGLRMLILYRQKLGEERGLTVTRNRFARGCGRRQGDQGAAFAGVGRGRRLAAGHAGPSR